VPRHQAKPYHHRRLREAVIESALAEIETVGPARLSMREIARRAGVSHAAPAHHFGDKRGIFTAIATEGFALLRDHTEPYLDRPNALLHSGLAYIGFASTHRSHFEVMFRPDLYDTEDDGLQWARIQSFDVLFRAVQQALGTGDPDAVTGTSIAAWSAVHGFAALWLSGNFPTDLTGHPDALAALVIDGLVAIGAITGAQAASGLPPMESFGITPNP
jgi:AcrR family transcriptional regulator